MKKDKTPTALKVVRWIFPKLEKIAPWIAHRFFITIFFTPLKYKVPEKELVLREEAEKFEVINEGKMIQCYAWGSGPVVLFVHGWAGRGTQFRKIIERFVKEGYRAVAFDGPAHGLSEGKSTNIIEFVAALKAVCSKVGKVEGMIAHSFGGSAVLFGATQGLIVKKLINIASPTMADEIIGTYLRTINGSWKTGHAFKKYVLKTSGKPFEEFTSIHFVKHLDRPVDLLLIHDTDDADVSFKQSIELKHVYPAAQIFKTSGLGHTRILKDERVIDECVTFIRGLRLSE